MRLLLAAIPITALTIAVPAANRIEPRFAGLPFLIVWICCWVLVTPVFVWMIGRVERRW